MANISDWYANSTRIKAFGPGATFLFDAAPQAKPSVIITLCSWAQQSTGDAIAILFYDRTTAPAAGSLLVGNADPRDDVRLIVPVSSGATGTIVLPLPGLELRRGAVIAGATSAVLGNVYQPCNNNLIVTVCYLPGS